MTDFGDEKLLKTLALLEESMTNRLPGTERARQLKVARETVWRRQQRLKKAAEETLAVWGEFDRVMDDLYLLLRHRLSDAARAAQREVILQLLRGDAVADSDVLEDCADLRRKYHQVLRLAEQLIASVRRLFKLAEALAVPHDDISQTYDELIEVLEQLRDLAQLSELRVHRAGILLGLIPRTGATPAD